MPERPDPIVVPPLAQPEDASKRAAVIFLHGLADYGASFEDLARQIQGAKRLPHVQWMFPTAPENRDMRSTAWYAITGLSPVPPSRPELQEDEDEAGLLQSMRYIVGLIDDLVSQGIPPERIVVGGFSQGCAMGLLIGLISKYAGKLAGIIALMGYLPLANQIEELRKEHESPPLTRMPTLLARGGSDILVPSRFFREAQARLKELGVPDEQLDVQTYDGVGHTVNGPVIHGLVDWLEKVLPEPK